MSTQREFSQDLAQRMWDALNEIAFADEANDWARKRAAQTFWIVTDPPPQEAIELGRELARKYGW